MRVVLDTNVLVRAVPGRNSPAEQVLLALLEMPHVIIASEFILNELARVLRYDRVRQSNGLDDAAIDAFVQSIGAASFMVALEHTPPIATDKDDDPIIASAIEGQADVLCTWDRHLCTPTVREYLAKAGIRVLRDTELLQELRPPPEA